MMKIGDKFKFNGEVGEVSWIGKSFDRKGYLLVGVDFPLSESHPEYGQWNYKWGNFYVRGCVKTLAQKGWGFGRW